MYADRRLVFPHFAGGKRYFHSFSGSLGGYKIIRGLTFRISSLRRSSSVAERHLGKMEVESPILSSGSLTFLEKATLTN